MDTKKILNVSSGQAWSSPDSRRASPEPPAGPCAPRLWPRRPSLRWRGAPSPAYGYHAQQDTASRCMGVCMQTDWTGVSWAGIAAKALRSTAQDSGTSANACPLCKAPLRATGKGSWELCTQRTRRQPNPLTHAQGPHAPCDPCGPMSTHLLPPLLVQLLREGRHHLGLGLQPIYPRALSVLKLRLRAGVSSPCAWLLYRSGMVLHVCMD